MSQTITPLDDTLSAPETIPDRSNLAKLYERPGKNSRNIKPGSKNTELAAAEISKISFKDTVAINLLVAIPYIVSFLSIVAMYSLGGVPNGVGEALENRIKTILLTIAALVPWVFSIRVLRNILWGYRIPLSGLVAIYSFFLLPIIQVSIKLDENGIPNFVYLPATLILSQIFIWLVAIVLKEKKIVLSRAAPLAVFMVVLLSLAIFL